MAILNIAILILILGIANCKHLEEDYDAAVIDAADLNENSIDGGDIIDLSHLGPEAYGTPKIASGDAVLEWSESSLINPEEMGEYAEGDILIPNIARNGIRGESSRWPNGIIPYFIEGYFNQEQRDLIMMAIADYHRLTCLHFVPYQGQHDYIVITNVYTGCWSSIGRKGKKHNFIKEKEKNTNNFGVSYDYNSVMHYSEYVFSRNQQKTIEPKVGGVEIGQREGLSRGDVRKVNNMYNCRKEEPQTDWVSAIWQSFWWGGGQK